MKLTEEQKQVVFNIDGPVAVIAVPGAGKTATLISRIGNLIINHKVSPNRILALSFSRASARDMNERFHKFFGDVVSEKVNFSTIHSFAYRVIMDYSRYINTKYTLIESNDSPISKNKLLRNLYFKHNKDYINEDKLEELCSYISFLINKMINTNSINEDELPVPKALEIYKDYIKTLQRNNFIDFDLMLLKCYEILKNNEKILNFYKSKYDYILLDEAQDTSVLQFQILKLMLNKNKNICIVGDDDQSIYSWRGAEVDQLLNFKTHFGEESKILFMNKNFRSTKKIVKVANEFIKENHKRFNKNLYTENEEGISIKITYPKDEFDQVDYIISRIKKENTLTEVALLYRNNLSSILIIDRLIGEGIPYYIKDNASTFFNSWIIKDILTFCSLSNDLQNVDCFEKIYFKMKSYVKKDQIENLYRDILLGKNIFQSLMENASTEYNKQRLKTLEENFNTLKTLAPVKAIDFILYDLNYMEYLKDYAKKFNYSMDTINTLLNTLKSLCSELTSIDEIEGKLDFIRENMESSNKNKYKNALTLTTFHSAKGLEFDTCYCIDMSADIIPTSESIIKKNEGDFSSYNEEVRLAYVGITRARKKLYLLSPQNRNNKNCNPSPFIYRLSKIVSTFEKPSLLKKILPEKILEGIEDRALRDSIIKSMKEGVTVNHKSFGEGKIIIKSGDFITILFDNGLEKTFSAKICVTNNLVRVI
ncbi:ATP-dependent helicase [uncultured Clostridium sp.]|uniref:ATP-dependent helicase n=1 Tax=uncultured Clostridium sp. TaxID=59620 RepID=UPI0028E4C0F3|nr:ATP-dependent helicase [uncultured Clostridium sp.]